MGNSAQIPVLDDLIEIFRDKNIEYNSLKSEIQKKYEGTRDQMDYPNTNRQTWDYFGGFSLSSGGSYLPISENAETQDKEKIEKLQKTMDSLLNRINIVIKEQYKLDAKAKNEIGYEKMLFKEIEIINKVISNLRTRLLIQILCADSLEKVVKKEVFFSTHGDPFVLNNFNKSRTNFDIGKMKSILDSLFQIRNQISKLVLQADSLSLKIFNISYSVNQNSLPKGSNVISEIDSLAKRVGRIVITGSKSMELIGPDKYFAQFKIAGKSSVSGEKMTYFSSPIQLIGDKTSIKIEISPRSDSLYLNKEIIEFELKAIRNKCFFSSGGAFYLSSLRNDNYSVQQIVTQTTEDTSVSFKLVEEYSNTFETGLLTLTYVGSMDDERSKLNDFGLHFGAGVGSSFTRIPKFRFTLGVGGFYEILDRHMLSVNAVMMTGYVDRLSKSLSLDQTYLAKPENFLVSKLAVGGAITIGYSFRISN